MKRAVALAGLLVALSPTAAAQEPPVRAWESPLRVPTYPVGPAEPNPMFYAGREYQGARGPVYPYPLLDRLLDQREDRAYRALWLENDYLKISVLPEIGGRIFTAQDKTNGYDFFYRQRVVKPALIGMLGAWISGGVEWNVFHHHRATTFMPVQSAITEGADGSRTVWVGETEWRQRMRWVVGLTVRPGRSYVEATVRMTNRTPLVHSMLYFSNPAVHTNESYQVIFPPDVDWATFHAKTDFAPWPFARGPFVGRDFAPGTDLSLWKNHPYPISFFVYRSGQDFLGGYDHGRRAGVVHVADRDTMPGKKFWTWGNGPDGRMWDQILTDEDGPYIELMTGGFSDNQPDYSWIQPGESRTVVHYWYPVRELGGVKAANLEGAINLEVKDGKVRLAANTTTRRRDARVRLLAGDRVVFETTATIAPDAPFAREIALPADIPADGLRLALLSAEGNELVAYDNRPRPKAAEPKRYAPPPPPAQVKTVEELYLAGLRLEQFHNPHIDPEAYYREALRRDPGDARTNTALGLLALRHGRFEDAEKRLTTAVARLTGNHTRARSGEAQYALGLALVGRGKTDAAREAFAAAGWDLALHRRRRARGGAARVGARRRRPRPRPPRPFARRQSPQPRGPVAEGGPPAPLRAASTKPSRRPRPRSPWTRSIPSPPASGASLARREPGRRRMRPPTPRRPRPWRRWARTRTPSSRRTTMPAPASSTTRSPFSRLACPRPARTPTRWWPTCSAGSTRGRATRWRPSPGTAAAGSCRPTTASPSAPRRSPSSSARSRLTRRTPGLPSTSATSSTTCSPTARSRRGSARAGSTPASLASTATSPSATPARGAT